MTTIPPKELNDIKQNKTPWYTNVRRADKTAGFASGMRRTLLDLNVKRDTYSDEIENDENQIYQIELELHVLRDMSVKLGERIERREQSDAEFQITLKDAKLASKKLKKATTALGGIAAGVDGSGRKQNSATVLYRMPDAE